MRFHPWSVGGDTPLCDTTAMALENCSGLRHGDEKTRRYRGRMTAADMRSPRPGVACFLRRRKTDPVAPAGIPLTTANRICAAASCSRRQTAHDGIQTGTLTTRDRQSAESGSLSDPVSGDLVFS